MIKRNNFLNGSLKLISRGIKMIKITFEKIIKSVVWHSKGDYFATMAHNI